MAGESSDFGASIAELQAVLLGTDSIDGFLQELAGLAESLGVLMRGSPALFFMPGASHGNQRSFPSREGSVPRSSRRAAGAWSMTGSCGSPARPAPRG
jgi:hypothetical protein